MAPRRRRSPPARRPKRAHAVLHEGALTLEDYWVRRSARAWFDLDGGLAALAPAADADGAAAGLVAPPNASARSTHCRALSPNALAPCAPDAEGA